MTKTIGRGTFQGLRVADFVDIVTEVGRSQTKVSAVDQFTGWRNSLRLRRERAE